MLNGISPEALTRCADKLNSSYFDTENAIKNTDQEESLILIMAYGLLGGLNSGIKLLNIFNERFKRIENAALYRVCRDCIGLNRLNSTVFRGIFPLGEDLETTLSYSNYIGTGSNLLPKEFNGVEVEDPVLALVRAPEIASVLSASSAANNQAKHVLDNIVAVEYVSLTDCKRFVTEEVLPIICTLFEYYVKYPNRRPADEAFTENFAAELKEKYKEDQLYYINRLLYSVYPENFISALEVAPTIASTSVIDKTILQKFDGSAVSTPSRVICGKYRKNKLEAPDIRCVTVNTFNIFDTNFKEFSQKVQNFLLQVAS